MKKYERERRPSSNNEQTPFASACQAMRTAANICHNYLLVAHPPVTQVVYAESGCMRSARLACLMPGSHEVSSRSALQIAVLPASFDTPDKHLYDHPRWQLLVYSWLGRQETLQLIAHLQSKTDISQMSFLIVSTKGCELVLAPNNS